MGRKGKDFFGTKININLLIKADYGKTDSDTGKIEKSQCDTYEMFLEKWDNLQEAVVKSIITYYNEEEQFFYGPDDEVGYQDIAF